jgi:hypothetical protein
MSELSSSLSSRVFGSGACSDWSDFREQAPESWLLVGELSTSGSRLGHCSVLFSLDWLFIIPRLRERRFTQKRGIHMPSWRGRDWRWESVGVGKDPEDGNILQDNMQLLEANWDVFNIAKVWISYESFSDLFPYGCSQKMFPRITIRLISSFIQSLTCTTSKPS